MNILLVGSMLISVVLETYSKEGSPLCTALTLWLAFHTN